MHKGAFSVFGKGAPRAWLHALRLPNVLITCVWFLLCLLPASKVAASLSIPLFLASLASLVFANLINDYYDVNADEANRPGTNVFALETQKNRALSFMIVALLLALLGFSVLPFPFYAAACLALGLSFGYARLFQYIPYLGIAYVSFAIAFLVFIPLYFLAEVSSLALFLFPSMAFMLTWLREWVKDIQDYKGDKEHKWGHAVSRMNPSLAYFWYTIWVVFALLIWAMLAYFLFFQHFQGVSVWSVLWWGTTGLLILLSPLALKRSASLASLCLKGCMLIGLTGILLFLFPST
jgi:4-hydroxybenzoate polyprenyltransferase